MGRADMAVLILADESVVSDVVRAGLMGAKMSIVTTRLLLSKDL